MREYYDDIRRWLDDDIPELVVRNFSEDKNTSRAAPRGSRAACMGEPRGLHGNGGAVRLEGGTVRSVRLSSQFSGQVPRQFDRFHSSSGMHGYPKLGCLQLPLFGETWSSF